MIAFKILPEQDAEIKRLHEEGFNAKSISNLTDVPVAVLRERYDFLADSSLPEGQVSANAVHDAPITREAAEESVSEGQLTEIADLVMQHKSVKQIAEATGLSQKTVRRLTAQIKTAQEAEGQQEHGG